jgi:hypothetical protein
VSDKASRRLAAVPAVPAVRPQQASHDGVAAPRAAARHSGQAIPHRHSMVRPRGKNPQLAQRSSTRHPLPVADPAQRQPYRRSGHNWCMSTIPAGRLAG